MKGIYLNLPDDVYLKVQEIAKQKGHLSISAVIRLVIMEYGMPAPKQSRLASVYDKTGAAKRLIGRPKKYSDRLCANCGHHEDIHRRDEDENWTGKCGFVECNCIQFEG